MNPLAVRAFEAVSNPMGRDFSEAVHILWPQVSADEIVRRFRHTLESGEPYLVNEYSEHRLDRGVREVYEWQINRIALPEGEYGVVCYFRDISRQVQTREGIVESEQKLRLATEAAELGIWHWYPDEDRASWDNDRCYEIHGRTREDGPLNRAEFMEKVVHPEDREAFNLAMAATLETGARLFFQGRIYRKDKSVIWIEFTGQVEHRADGSPLRVLGTILDISERKRAEENYKSLAETLDAEVRVRTNEVVRQSELLRDLSSRLLQAQDEERRRIARELHDSAGQILVALSLNLAQAAQHAPPESRVFTEECEQLVRQLSQEIRTMSYLLHPPLLDETGLSEALRWYIQGLSERSGLEIVLDISPQFERLPREMELVMFRLVQECLTNIHRHSGSETAVIRIVRDNENVTLEVEDKGKGMSAGKLVGIQAQSSGVGIRGMRERVRHFGGIMNIESDKNGTKISFVLPVPKESKAEESVPPGDVDQPIQIAG
jgi:PAS domain S-box-containing protein